MSKSYREKLLDPRWQKRRLEVLNDHEWTCQKCCDTGETLHVHHKWYEGINPWDAPNEALTVLCANCHKEETELWREVEPRLVRLMHRLFFADDLSGLLDIWEDVGEFHVSGVMADVVGWGIRNFKTVEEYVFEEYKARADAKKSEAA